ncbi:outer membrane beta-barrel protein [Helicobacter saguini]|uniref:Outer membrane beta-barrel protein n=1 Tax=Helicobacter saguini TaxID=1548018 RepID=A0A6L7DB70_9HELI|nr:outer membrane beta-barrel protein [Helicobacter saguini]MWV68485.1 outer membrane beta-barrel protein [Helicobacter saguini]
MAGALSGSAYAESSGFILGLGLGGGAALNVAGVGAGGTGGLAGANSVGTSNTAVFLGARLGYQMFVDEANGFRFYVSDFLGYAQYPDSASTTPENPVSHRLNMLLDLNADYLYNWSTMGVDAGFYVGFGGGAIFTIPVGNFTWAASAPAMSAGASLAVNAGLRTSINDRHQIEFGVKAGFGFFARGSVRDNAVSAVVLGHATYTIKL